METINVVEMVDEDIISIKSFAQNADGKIDAKKMFKALAIEKGAEEDETRDFFDEGYYESGSYQLFLKESD
jgi:hypothetical protein